MRYRACPSLEIPNHLSPLPNFRFSSSFLSASSRHVLKISPVAKGDTGAWNCHTQGAHKLHFKQDSWRISIFINYHVYFFSTACHEKDFIENICSRVTIRDFCWLLSFKPSTKQIALEGPILSIGLTLATVPVDEAWISVLHRFYLSFKSVLIYLKQLCSPNQHGQRLCD